MRSSLFMSFPKAFESVMEDQMISQNRRIADENKIGYIHQTHDFIQRHIFSEI